MHFIHYLFIVLASALTAACHVCAPPIRAANNGAPGKMREGDLEFGAAGTVILVDDYLETPGIHAGAGYAITDKTAIEAGADAIVTNSVIGNIGLRIAPFPIDKQRGRTKLLFDVAFGGGLGVGGRQATIINDDDYDHDGVEWKDRLAGGGYFSMAIGLNIKWFDWFARVVLQVSKAENIPTTLIGSMIYAPQFTLDDVVQIYLGPGVFFYRNASELNGSVYFELGLSFKLGLSKNEKEKKEKARDILN